MFPLSLEAHMCSMLSCNMWSHWVINEDETSVVWLCRQTGNIRFECIFFKFLFLQSQRHTAKGPSKPRAVLHWAVSFSAVWTKNYKICIDRAAYMRLQINDSSFESAFDWKIFSGSGWIIRVRGWNMIANLVINCTVSPSFVNLAYVTSCL